MDHNTVSSQFAASFTKALNAHGIAFQEGVAAAMDALKSTTYRWEVETTEFPVRLQGRDTRIDILLQAGLRDAWDDEGCGLLVCECKRVNPAYGSWVFFRSARPRRYSTIVHEALFWRENKKIHSYTRELSTGNKLGTYDLAMELKTGGKGDEAGKLGPAIEDAATQVLRCTGGLIETLVEQYRALWHGRVAVNVLPAIITTAQLYISEVDLRTTDIITGNVAASADQIRPVKWLLYQYPGSPGLRHSVPRAKRDSSFEDYRRAEHERTIAVVNSSGLAEFSKELPQFELPTAPNWAKGE